MDIRITISGQDVGNDREFNHGFANIVLVELKKEYPRAEINVDLVDHKILNCISVTDCAGCVENRLRSRIGAIIEKSWRINEAAWAINEKIKQLKNQLACIF